jgi:acyl-CoA-binding protein
LNSLAKPWWFVFEARKKWNSWNSLKGTSSEDAMTEYIQLAKEKARVAA